MTPLQVLFYGISALTLAAAVGVVVARNVIYSAVFLLIALMAIAGLFVLLFAQFLAIVQVLLYGGAIIIVLFFAIMLTRQPNVPQKLDNPQWPLALVASGLVFAAFAGVLLGARWAAREPGPSVDLARLGETLFVQWAIPFELASLLLLIALMGAIIIARPGDRE